MNSDRRTIAGNLEKLRNCGLITTPTLYGHFFGVGIVPHSDKHLALWRERWQTPRLVPTLAAYFTNGLNELLGEEDERSFARILSQYGIDGSIQERIVTAADGLGINDSDFALLVKQTDNDHRSNVVAGKVRVAHSGFLLLAELNSRIAVAAARKAASSGHDRDERYWEERQAKDTLGDVQRLLSVRNQCCELLRQVVGKATIRFADGTDELITLTWTNVKESLTESRGDLERFKNSIATKLIPRSLSSPDACPWLHAWRKLRPVPRPDYEMLQQRFQPNPQKEHLFSVVQEEIDKWAYANSRDDADAQTNANLLAAAIAERCSPNGERISYESYAAAKKVLLESGQLAFV